ncbi:MAG: heme NO-binding domain-containing protein [Gaiellaceae bacterium]
MKTGWATGPGRSAPKPTRGGRHKIGVALHGVIFTSFRDYLTAAHGVDRTRELFANEPIYLLSEAYPDERLLDLIARTAAATGRTADEVVYGFGVFTGEITFTRLYPAFFSAAPSAREFLLNVEERIHELVRATIPHAVPPQLKVSELGSDGVTIDYSSPRQLCVLLRGLAEGTARHYGETAAIHEIACMRQGAPSCRFEIRLSPSSRGA